MSGLPKAHADEPAMLAEIARWITPASRAPGSERSAPSAMPLATQTAVVEQKKAELATVEQKVRHELEMEYQVKTSTQTANVEYLRPVRRANWAADIPLRSNSARMTRRCSRVVRTRPLVSTVTDNFAADEDATAGTESDLPGVIIALIAMTLTGNLDQRCYG